MARRKVKIETPPSTAPTRWRNVLAEHWQSHGGKWAAPQHYNCTYMAMFPPELPHYFIQRFTKPGDIVLDPFSGRGTTAVEASAQGRIGIGNDLNPLAVALSRGKISNPRLEDVLERLKQLQQGYDSKKWEIDSEPDKIKMIYHPNTLSQLCYLKENLDWSKQGPDAFLVSVLMGAMHGASSGFLSVSMPNTFSMGWNYVEKYIREKELECPDRDVFEVLEKRVKRYLKKGYLVGSGKMIEGDVRDLDSKIEHNSVQLLFTSPPYLKVIKYGLYNWIRLWFLTESGSHEEVDAKLDDTHALNEYLEFMKDTLTASLPLLDRKRGLSCWAIGDVKGLNLAWAVWHHAGSKIEVKADDGTILRYKLIAIVEDKIPDNQKVSKIWKTLAYHLEYVDENDKVVESVGKWENEKDAKKAMKNAVDKDGLELKIRVEKENDKSGKATPIDRILIIAPESSNPKAFMEAHDLDWKPFRSDWKDDAKKLFDAWDKKYMVVSLDADGLMCASLLSKLYPQVKLGGFYNEKGELYTFGDMTVEQSKDALWVDLDIFDKQIKSIGQHLFKMTNSDEIPRHEHSFNPNEYFKQAMYHLENPTKKNRRMASFWANNPNKWQTRDKYPLATLHIIMELFEIEWPTEGYALQLLLHPDSTWATTFAYPQNVGIWIDNMFDAEFWKEYSGVNFIKTDTIFKDRIDFVDKIRKWFKRDARGTKLPDAIRERLSLNELPMFDIEALLGLQSFKGTLNTKRTRSDNINQFLEFVSEELQWEISFIGMDFDNYELIGKGITKEAANPLIYQKIEDELDWGDFVRANRVFSGVIKGSMDNKLRYTQDFKWIVETEAGCQPRQRTLFNFMS